MYTVYTHTHTRTHVRTSTSSQTRTRTHKALHAENACMQRARGTCAQIERNIEAGHSQLYSFRQIPIHEPPLLLRALLQTLSLSRLSMSTFLLNLILLPLLLVSLVSKSKAVGDVV